MTVKSFGMIITEARCLCNTLSFVSMIMTVALLAASVDANQPPVADAGPSRYAGDEPIVLDGTGSYDPDPGDTLTYQWAQVSGPSVVLTDTDTATPTMTATLSGNVEIVELQLTVSDNLQATSTDTVQVTLVSEVLPPGDRFAIGDGDTFDPNKPTFVYFRGGDCWAGFASSWSGDEWKARANLIRTPQYMPDICESWDCPWLSGAPRTYFRFGNALIVFLSSIAPDYDQPIEIAGASTGGMPAIDSAIQMNSFQDPRYNVTRVTFLDAACRHYGPSVEAFARNPVAGEPAWVVDYGATYGGDTAYYGTGAFNVYVQGTHNTPVTRFKASISEDFYPYPDVYNHGVVAGAFLSVVGEGKNYNVPPEATGYYLFYWDYFVHYSDQENYPGALPEPVILVGPLDNTVTDAAGVTLGCEASEHAVAYQLLWGKDKANLQVVYENDGPFSVSFGPLPPDQIFYWTVKVCDQYGTTIFADPRSFVTPPSLLADLNKDTVVDQADCALLKAAINTPWDHDLSALTADLDGDELITCDDAQIWLNLYRGFLQDPAAPDPCGLEDATDSDGDGTSDVCDNCPTANPNQDDTDSDGVGDVCDNCPTTRNTYQEDTDGDSWGNVCDYCPTTWSADQVDTDGDLLGDVCDDDDDDDGVLDPIDNCPVTPNPDQVDIDGDSFGDACDDDDDGDAVPDLLDNCPTTPNAEQIDTDGDSWGDVCDNCPTTWNVDQVDTDEDSIGDICDDDDDGDGVLDLWDNCPNQANSDQLDTDGDGAGDVCDPDIDNDGMPNEVDNCPMAANADQEDTDSDGDGDACDFCTDTDGDGFGTPDFPANKCIEDNCPDVPNPTQADLDNDGVGDVCDDDVDGDGLLNGIDNCPVIPNPDQYDDDGDEVGTVCDACPGTMAGATVDENGCPLPVPGDFDGDNDVDQKDFGAFQLCMGCDSIAMCPGCEQADLYPVYAPDHKVDRYDFDVFEGCVSGPTIAADPHCAD